MSVLGKSAVAAKDYGTTVMVMAFFLYQIIWPQMGQEQDKLDRAIAELTIITERQSRIQMDLTDLTETLSGDVKLRLDDHDRRLLRLEIEQESRAESQ